MGNKLTDHVENVKRYWIQLIRYRSLKYVDINICRNKINFINFYLESKFLYF